MCILWWAHVHLQGKQQHTNWHTIWCSTWMHQIYYLCINVFRSHIHFAPPPPTLQPPLHPDLHCSKLHLPVTAQWQASCTLWHLPQRTCVEYDREKVFMSQLCTVQQKSNVVKSSTLELIWGQCQSLPSVSLYQFFVVCPFRCVALSCSYEPPSACLCCTSATLDLLSPDTFVLGTQIMIDWLI